MKVQSIGSVGWMYTRLTGWAFAAVAASLRPANSDLRVRMQQKRWRSAQRGKGAPPR
jgi:hypothetical protein